MGSIKDSNNNELNIPTIGFIDYNIIIKNMTEQYVVRSKRKEK